MTEYYLQEVDYTVKGGTPGFKGIIRRFGVCEPIPEPPLLRGLNPDERFWVLAQKMIQADGVTLQDWYWYEHKHHQRPIDPEEEDQWNGHRTTSSMIEMSRNEVAMFLFETGRSLPQVDPISRRSNG